MFNKYFLNTAFTLTLSLGSFAQAGGVGSGGGQTTVPDPSHPEQIARTLETEARFMIQAWLNRQEKNFNEQSASVRAQNPLRKIFENQPGLSQLIATVPAELRMTNTCHDSANSPVDGSIYGKKPGSICLSPFSMAPKLSQQNYKAETFALLVHELSHLLGTTEDEAEIIQQVALKDFLAKDPVDLKNEAGWAAEEISNRLRAELDSFAQLPPNLRSNSEKFISILRTYQDIEDAYQSDKNRFLFVTPTTDAYYMAEYIRYDLLHAFICSQDTSLGKIRQELCADTLERAFKGNSKATLSTITANLGIVADRLTPAVANSVVVINPTSWSTFDQSLNDAREFFKKFESEFSRQMYTQILTYR